MAWYAVRVTTADDDGNPHSHRRELEANSDDQAEALARKYVESDGVTVLSVRSLGEIPDPGTPEREGWGEGTLDE